MKINRTISTMGAAFAMGLVGSYAADVNITADITSDTVWTSNNVYILKKPVFVKDGAKLTIEPGTIIYSSSDTKGTPETTDDEFGSLVITRGSKIFAEGTSEKPIVFTALEERDGFDDDDNSSTPNIFPDAELGDSGFWGGLILLGKAPINNYQGATNLNEADIEGFPAGSGDDIKYGGLDEHDSSGVLRFVSIRFGGFEFAPNEEINGLTLGGVGDGTHIEYVEVIANSDDGIEFFGGTVNTRYMVAAFCQDESFDIDQGHQGTHQYWFALQNEFGDNGTEADGGDGDTKTGLPLTNTKVYNATYIGGGSTAGSSNDAFRLKDNFAGQFHNSVFHDFGGDAMRLDDAVTAAQVGGNLLFQNNTWGTFGAGPDHGNNAAELTLLGQAGNSAVGTDPLLRGISRSADNGLDPRPAANSPLWAIPEGIDTNDLAGTTSTTTLSTIDPADQNILTNTVYRGAFGLNNWLDKWSYLSENNFLATSGSSATPPVAIAARSEVVVSGPITSTTVWTADNNYILPEPIFVNGDATLLIEPGVQVFGNGLRINDSSNGGVDDTDFGSLVITRGSKLIAEGTSSEPIVFTSRDVLEVALGAGGDLGAALPDPLSGDAGLWGGLIMLGKAPVNNFQGATNLNQADIEGFPTGSSADIQYGGVDANDYSGNLRFVSIQFGGFEFAPNEEINGLTLGGVGNATGVEYVEVLANSDDGVEFFGGTVNTKRMLVAFCQDESFDIDQGHQGNHQFWFALQNEFGDNGTEADGGDGDTKTGLPLTNTKVYNATYIGGGSTAESSNDAFRLKDNFAGQFHNSIFHDFGGEAMRIDDPETAAQVGGNLLFQNNIWGTFGEGADHGGDASELTLLGQAGNSAVGTDPQLRDIDRISGEFDPRPFLGSPALTTTLTAVTTTDAGVFYNADYRGAFGMANWADCWSYLAVNGHFTDISAVVETADYLAWRGTELNSETSLITPFEDFNADGLSNFVSYAFAMDPQDIADRNNLPKVTNATTGEVTYTRRKTSLTGLAYSVFLSTDLDFGAVPAVEGAGGDYTQQVSAIPATDDESVIITPNSVGTKLYVKVIAE